MSKIKFMLLSIMAVFMASCSHEFDPVKYSENIYGKYADAFVKTFGTPDKNQTWGFGSGVSGTRALFDGDWSGTHTCGVSNWQDVLTFEKPENAVDLTDKSLFNEYGNYVGPNNVTDWYIPENFSGSLNLHNMNLGGNVYVLGKLTDLQSVNYSGTVTFYIEKGASMTYTVQSGNRHTVVNKGDLTVTSFNNIGLIYNGGSLTLGTNWAVDIPNAMTIYSNGEGTVEMPKGGDLKAVCDIHGTLTADGNIKIQNSTKKYICGIVATGTIENVDGALETSYVEANVFKFDGNHIYLLPGGHVNVTTLQTGNSQCNFYGAVGSTGLVEAVNYEFGNKNDFTHSFSSNIYFKVNGGYIKCDNCYAMGHNHYFNNIDEYLAFDGHTSDNKSDEYGLAADRINAGTATGSPACGQPWSVGTPTEPTYEFLCRVFAEDLSAETGTDFDFNDVVFDVYKEVGGKNAKVEVLAAGGTLELFIDGVEVHGLFNVNTNVMVNTGGGLAVDNLKAKEPIFVDNVFTSGNDLADVRDHIKVTVLKDGYVLCELTAVEGKPASKFAVTDQTVKWADERQDITEKYPMFEEWVKTKQPARWWE